MTSQVVWVAGQKPSFFAKHVEAVKAAVFHYQRVLFGPQFGMGVA